jgi:hypothetical protein
MTETLDLEPQANLDTAAKRALIESELRKDAGRSDREIGRVCGVDGKTVSATRAKLAGRAENSPQPRPTAEERVDGAIAKDAVKLAPDDTDLETFWQIPHQAAIECRPVA